MLGSLLQLVHAAQLNVLSCALALLAGLQLT